MWCGGPWFSGGFGVRLMVGLDDLKDLSDVSDCMIMGFPTLIPCIQVHERSCEQSLDSLLAP